MPTLKASYWILLPVLVATIVVYANGLAGPFLFDDSIHITQNRWVKIESLNWDSLVQAWNSSFSKFPSNRPLAQLTFGINHALAGLDPWAFKATNLGIHLVTGILVFLFVRLAFRAVTGEAANRQRETALALAVAAVWLLHPLHVSTVLYTVQRMALLSSFSMLAGLTCYVWGRLQIANGRPGAVWIIAAAPIAILGFFAKENTVLLPLLLLVTELTLLRAVPTGNRRGFIRFIWVLFIVVPLITGLVYVFEHPSMFSHEGRSFTMEQRVLTQPRILWHYLHWLFVPDITAFNLFHDDIAVSTSLFDPPSTLIAIAGLAALSGAAVLFRRKAPFFAFGVLFFLANHVLESTAIPLEMVFEHRNYLASLGPLLILGHLVIISSAGMNLRPLAMILGTLLLLSYATVTYIRVNNWSSYASFILSSAENHPQSARSNFMAAQLLISVLDKSEDAAPELADSARAFLNDGLQADPRCINCLFGLLVLDQHQGRRSAPALIARLTQTLEAGFVGPTKVSISQFSYLVKLQRSGGPGLPAEDLEAIFDAAISNPAWNRTGRAGIESAYREYYEFVAQDLPTAVQHAQSAIQSWPDQWQYHMNLVQLLGKLKRFEEALAALDDAARVADNEAKQLQTAKVRASIERILPR